MLTIHDVIRYLPLEQKLKKNLLEKYDTLDMDTQYKVWDMLWATYDALFQLKLQENIQVAYMKSLNGEEEIKLNPSFYKEMREKTEKEMHQETTQVSTTNELDSVREKLQQLIQHN